MLYVVKKNEIGIKLDQLVKTFKWLIKYQHIWATRKADGHE